MAFNVGIWLPMAQVGLSIQYFQNPLDRNISLVLVKSNLSTVGTRLVVCFSEWINCSEYITKLFSE